MTAEGLASRGPLWAQPRDGEEQTLPLWKAALLAAALELLLPLLVFGVDWSFLRLFREPPPIPVMSVRLEQPPAETLPEPRPPEREKPKDRPPPQKLKKLKQVALEPPKPLPEEAPSKIALPKPEPKPQPKPKEEEKKPEPPPLLPSVFRDVKPVKKVRPKYPPEAEAQHIEGRVKVRLSVELDGSVSNVEVLLSEPPGVFDAAVLEAVRQYKFKKDGTTYQADQEVVFKIDD
ncbi:MAG TPA: TonB family protein [Burkholderiales bacterium]|nr:TonB family protein [Burkholderiales bacterium]